MSIVLFAVVSRRRIPRLLVDKAEKQSNFCSSQPQRNFRRQQAKSWIDLAATMASIAETRGYDSRLRLNSITDGSIYTLTIPATTGYAPNSDILAANDSANGNWAYAYDDFNRLASATQSGQPAYTDVYDRYGNRWNQLYNGACTAGSTFCATFDGNNHNNNGLLVYDAAGNVTQDNMHHYGYDGENRLVSVDSGTTAAYVYDAEGKRVRKTTGGLSVDYVYDLAGAATTEFNSTGGWNRGEVYAGGRHVATYAASTTYFDLGDWVGTERVRTTAAGVKCETVTSLAFGDGQAVTGSCGDPSPLHFTGKQRDAESGLDNFGARYNSSSMGRFMTPDSTAYVKPINPQSWNLYGYALANPLLYVDPAGNTVSLANCHDRTECVKVLSKAAQLPKGVTATVDKNGNLKLEGDLSKIKGGNALRLMQLVNSDKTANFWIGDKAPGMDRGQIQDVNGGRSGTTSQGYDQNFSVVQSDPSSHDSGLGGVFLNPDGTIAAGQIPGANIGEAAAHELLGHVWADLIGGQSAGTQGNMLEALIAEDRVRNTDPSRGIKVRHQDNPDSVQSLRPNELHRVTN